MTSMMMARRLRIPLRESLRRRQYRTGHLSSKLFNTSITYNQGHQEGGGGLGRQLPWARDARGPENARQGATYPVRQVRRAPYHFFISRTIDFLFIH